MITKITPEQFIRIMMDCSEYLGLPNRAFAYQNHLNDINLYLDSQFDTHIFEYFYDYLILFGDSRRELLFRLKYGEYL